MSSEGFIRRNATHPTSSVWIIAERSSNARQERQAGDISLTDRSAYRVLES